MSFWRSCLIVSKVWYLYYDTVIRYFTFAKKNKIYMHDNIFKFFLCEFFQLKFSTSTCDIYISIAEVGHQGQHHHPFPTSLFFFLLSSNYCYIEPFKMSLILLKFDQLLSFTKTDAIDALRLFFVTAACTVCWWLMVMNWI